MKFFLLISTLMFALSGLLFYSSINVGDNGDITLLQLAYAQYVPGEEDEDEFSCDNDGNCSGSDQICIPDGMSEFCKCELCDDASHSCNVFDDQTDPPY